MAEYICEIEKEDMYFQRYGELKQRLVRCKDCKYWSDQSINGYHLCTRWKNQIKNFATKGNWFCANGEPKDAEKEGEEVADLDMTKTILEHLKKKDEKFADPCYYLNYEEDLVAIIKWYYYEKLGWCGCGCPGDAMRVIARYLEARSLTYPESDAKMKEYFAPDGDENDLVLCLAYELDRAGFTDHGSSIFSCWLTDDGKFFLWAIQEAEKQKVLDF